MSHFFHEELHRGNAALAQMKDFRITICGAGALGANIAESLVRAGCGKLRIIDMDRVEARNLSTQPYLRSDIGAQKARMLSNMLYRATGVKLEAIEKKLTAENAGKMLSGSDLVIDTFDNSVGRADIKNWCLENEVPCLHAGMAGDYAEVIWNADYRVPSAANDDVCDYPLARNLVGLTTAVASETAIAFVTESVKNSFTITLGDFAVRPFESVV